MKFQKANRKPAQRRLGLNVDPGTSRDVSSVPETDTHTRVPARPSESRQARLGTAPDPPRTAIHARPWAVATIAARSDAATNALGSPAEHTEGCSTGTLRRHPHHKLPRGFPGLTHDRLRIGGFYRWCQQDRQAILTVSACQFSRRDECVVCSEPTKKGGGMRRQASVAARLKRFVPFAA